MSEPNFDELPVLPPTRCVKVLVNRVEGEHLVDARFCGYPEAGKELLHNGETIVDCEIERAAGKCATKAMLAIEGSKVVVKDISE
jgi:hypothetical protein